MRGAGAWLSITALCAVLVAGCAKDGNNALPSHDTSIFSVDVTGLRDSVYTESVSRFVLRSAEADFRLPDTPYQKVVTVSSGGSGSEISLVTGLYRETEGYGPGQYKENTRLLNLESPELMDLAARFRGSRAPVADVSRFVDGFIANKTLGVPIVPVQTIIRNRSGDCTEHAVLAVAMLRRLTVPARAVVGMLLCEEFGARKNVFVYHMWAEAWWRGKWELVDATRPGNIHPNRYVAFAYHNLKAEMPIAYLRAISAIRNLSVEYRRADK